MRPLGPAAIAALLVVAGCSGGDDGAPPTTTSPSSAGSSEVSTGPASSVAGAATTATSLRPPTSVPIGGAPQGFGAVSVLVDSVTELCLWLAATASERQQGLMGVTSLGGADGMLFDFDGTTAGEFWMFQTLLPLSIAFYDAGGGFVSSTDMDPCTSADGSGCVRYPAAAPYAYAIETAQGGLEDLGLVAGSRIVPGASCTPG